jgi:hypothetical protein
MTQRDMEGGGVDDSDEKFPGCMVLRGLTAMFGTLGRLRATFASLACVLLAKEAWAVLIRGGGRGDPDRPLPPHHRSST